MTLIPAFQIGIWNAWLFMIVFLLQMIAILFADKRIRGRSHVHKHVRRNRFEKYAGVIANYIWLAAMGYSVFLPFQPGTIWFYFGLSIFIIGLILITIATVNFIATPADLLITKGIYKLSRHPMYLATFFICLGSGLASVSLLFIFLSIVMAFCLHKEALIEERYCLDKYGSAYREYLNSVPRWFGLIIY
jgi:protein-S-isoprenylcysteine O-methyltransferase Ste14